MPSIKKYDIFANCKQQYDNISKKASEVLFKTKSLFLCAGVYGYFYIEGVNGQMMKEKYLRIIGGNNLSGKVFASGSKNSISAIIPALCLADDTDASIVYNVPDITDVDTMCNILSEVGKTFEKGDNYIKVSGTVKNNVLSPDNVSKIRASSLFIGALLSATGEASVPFCGGDKIGDRPLDIHFYALDKFKVKTEIKNGLIHCKATQFPLEGQTVFLRYPSVGATENAIMLAVKARGTSYIYNAAMEPEVTDMATMLNKMGANITGAGTPIIKVRGVEKLSNTQYDIITDRLEVGTFLIAFSCTKGEGTVLNAIPEHCMSIISTLRDCGVEIRYEGKNIYVNARNSRLTNINVNAMPYPGIPTDLQPLFTLLSTQCNGDSLISDSVHKERFSYISEFRKMGVNLHHIYDQVIVKGVQNLSGGIVVGGDIRAVTTLVMAGLTAKGETMVYGLDHLYRGYEHFVEKLTAIGANIRVSE